MSVVVNNAEKIELSTLTTEQLRAGVHYLGQISGAQVLPERQLEPDSPTVTRHPASEASILTGSITLLSFKSADNTRQMPFRVRHFA